MENVIFNYLRKYRGKENLHAHKYNYLIPHIRSAHWETVKERKQASNYGFISDPRIVAHIIQYNNSTEQLGPILSGLIDAGSDTAIHPQAEEFAIAASDPSSRKRILKPYLNLPKDILEEDCSAGWKLIARIASWNPFN